MAVQIHAAIRGAAEPLGLMAASPDAYRERTQKQRLALIGMTAAEVDARLAERTEARQAKDFARADAVRRELDALGIEVADGTEGSTWRASRPAAGPRLSPDRPYAVDPAGGRPHLVGALT